LDLFSGIGGFALGLERAGIETAAFCEMDEKARAVLAKHWPDVPRYTDVRSVTKSLLESDGITGINAICGGFPCQDISLAGRGAGLAGERSGLWWEFHRLIAEFQPQIVIAENVSVLRSRGLGDILRSLFALGYDAEWHCIPASHVGAPHQRDRIWIIAYPSSAGLSGPILSGDSLPIAARTSLAQLGDLGVQVGPSWSNHSEYLRMGDGVSRGMDRLKQCGNAVVPLIPELIGRAIKRVF
jgi:DNA (cytosine-5)-methyltransferase 1